MIVTDGRYNSHLVNCGIQNLDFEKKSATNLQRESPIN